MCLVVIRQERKMTITLEPELKQKFQAAARRAGQDGDGYVGVLLWRQLAVQDNAAMDRQTLDERLQCEFNEAMPDPLFVQDMNETMKAYCTVAP